MGDKDSGAPPSARVCDLLGFRSVAEGVTLLLLVVLALSVVFDYINGFHDTANAIATSVSTRALRPEHAILMSAAANFLGALTGTAVAKTIGAGLVDSDRHGPGRASRPRCSARSPGTSSPGGSASRARAATPSSAGCSGRRSSPPVATAIQSGRRVLARCSSRSSPRRSSASRWASCSMVVLLNVFRRRQRRSA